MNALPLHFCFSLAHFILVRFEANLKGEGCLVDLSTKTISSTPLFLIFIVSPKDRDQEAPQVAHSEADMAWALAYHAEDVSSP